jgi:hypothetical protein
MASPATSPLKKALIKSLFSRDSLRMLVPKKKKVRQVHTEIGAQELEGLIHEAEQRVRGSNDAHMPKVMKLRLSQSERALKLFDATQKTWSQMGPGQYMEAQEQFRKV